MDETQGLPVLDITDGIHFSGKYVHTAANKIGIRLGGVTQLQSPYLCLRRLLSAGANVPLDYASDASMNATRYKYAAALMGWQFNENAEEAPPHHVILPGQGGVVGEEDVIGLHLRQILFPVDDSYLSLVPLSSGPFSHVLTQRIKAFKALNKEHFLRSVSLAYGGSNPANAGRYVLSLRNTLISSGPQEDPGIRRAFAIYYKGVRITLPRDSMWAFKEVLANKAGFYRTLHAARVIRTLLTAVIAQAKEEGQFLNRYHDILPGEGHHDSVDKALSGLSGNLSDRKWQSNFSEFLAKRIGDYRFSNKDSIGLDTVERQWIASIIQRVFRYAI